MAKGNPNDSSKLNNFVAKVYDPTAKTYRPIYVLPDATDKVLGGVYLSDSTSGTDKAATGVIAATPAAVKAANDNANTKLSMTSTSEQTVKSATTFTGLITANGGVKGSLTGNASTATKLATARTISIKGGANGTAASGTFDGSSNLSLTLSTLDATALTGLVPLASIPQGALERLVKVADQTARFKLTTSSVQLGDSVLQTDTGVMYIVVDENNLANANGYQEYKASTALKASAADTATKATQDSAGQQINTTYIKGLSVSGQTVTYTKGDGTTGTIKTQDTNTTYSAGTGISLSGTTFSNSGVRSIATGGTNGTISVNTNGTTANVAVKGLGSAAYTESSAYAAASHTHSYLPLSGGALTGNVTLTRSGSVDAAYTATNSDTGNSVSLMVDSGKVNRGLYDNTKSKWMVYTDSNGSVILNGNAATATSATSATTATTANRLNQTLSLAGAVTGSVSMNSDGNKSITTVLASSIVKTANIADSNVTLAKLSTDIGTVYTGTTEPTDSRVKIWVNI